MDNNEKLQPPNL